MRELTEAEIQEISKQAIENVADSEAAREMIHRYLDPEDNFWGNDLTADLSTLLDAEIEYLTEQKYAAQQEALGDDLRKMEQEDRLLGAS